MIGKDKKALDVLTRINGQTEARTILANIKATAHEAKEPIFTYG